MLLWVSCALCIVCLEYTFPVLVPVCVCGCVFWRLKLSRGRLCIFGTSTRQFYLFRLFDIHASALSNICSCVKSFLSCFIAFPHWLRRTDPTATITSILHGSRKYWQMLGFWRYFDACARVLNVVRVYSINLFPSILFTALNVKKGRQIQQRRWVQLCYTQSEMDFLPLIE